ncbi:hypothetical protein ACX0MU_00310 [Rhizorhabdus wittichii]
MPAPIRPSGIMISLVFAMAAAASSVSQSAFEARAKVCNIDLSRHWKPPHWRAERRDDGTTVLVTEYLGQEAENRCLEDWAKKHGIIFIRIRD